MELRETINQHPKAVAAGVGVAIVVLVLLTGLQLASSHTSRPAPPTLSYFSDDDGKTFFADDISLVAPIQRGGHEVDAACVFQCNGKRFVGYLERAVSPEAAAFIADARRQMLAAAAAQPQPGPDSETLNKIMRKLEIKKPGDATWVNELSPAARQVMTVDCPDGTAIQVGP